MKKRDKINVYFILNNRYHLLFRVVQMGGNGTVDLKITDYYGNFAIIGSKVSETGCLSEVEMDKTSYYSKVEMSYHPDGSFLHKISDFEKPMYTNPYGTGVRWTPTNEISDFQPVFCIQIRRMDIYRKCITSLPTDTVKNKNYVCDCDELFDINGTYYLVLFIRNKSFPFCRCGCSTNYSDVITELNSQLELCLLIQRASYPQPQSYFSTIEII